MIRTLLLCLLTVWGFSETVAEAFTRRLPEGSRVLQFGSSRSSDWLSARYELCTVESKIELINEHDADYVFAPIAEGWYDRDAIRKFAPCEYDGILINSGAYQKEVLANLDLLKRDVPIFVCDNQELAEKIGSALRASDATVQ